MLVRFVYCCGFGLFWFGVFGLISWGAGWRLVVVWGNDRFCGSLVVWLLFRWVSWWVVCGWVLSWVVWCG